MQSLPLKKCSRKVQGNFLSNSEQFLFTAMTAFLTNTELLNTQQQLQTLSNLSKLCVDRSADRPIQYYSIILLVH